MANGMSYISEFTETKAQTAKIVAELESELNVWEAEKMKWDEYIIRIIEVQTYDILLSSQQMCSMLLWMLISCSL